MKPNLIDKVVGYFSPSSGAARARSRLVMSHYRGQGGYDGAGKGRRTEGWVSGSDQSQNSLNRQSLARLRQVHRDLVRNNPYASAAVDATVSYTVGDGIMPVARHPNEEKRKLAQVLMDEWASSLFCDADGNMDLYGLEALVMRSESESGEAIAMPEFVRSRESRIPLRIRVMEGDFIDHTKNDNTGSGTIQGVEFDSSGRRTGYWIYRTHPGEMITIGGSSQLVSANRVAHIFEVRRPGQVRGIPRGSSVITKLKNLDEFQDARLEQQKIAACLVGFIQQGEDGKQKGDILPERMEPGLIARLEEGESAGFNTPPSTSGQDLFIKGEEQLVSKGYGLNYQTLTGDLSDANFANGKLGRLDMYANIRRWRKFMLIPQFCKKVEGWFLEAAELAGFDLRGVVFDWNPPRAEILNLKDDIPAMIRQTRAGFGSISAMLRSIGYNDPEAVLREMAKDNELLDELGLILDTDPRYTGGNGQLQGSAGASEKRPEEEDEQKEES